MGRLCCGAYFCGIVGLTVLSLGLVGCPLLADVKINGDLKVPAYGMADLTAELKGSGEKTRYNWSVQGKTGRVVKLGNRVLFTGPPGEYRVRVSVVDFKQEIFEETDLVVVFEGASPKPPDPGPKPPDPKPPGPLTELKVLIIEEAMQRTRLPPAQQIIILGKPMRDYLNARCAPDPNTDSGKAWNIWDQNIDTSKAAKFYQDAMRQPRTSLPWIVIGNDSVISHSGPLPADTAATIDEINKFSSARRKAG